MKVPKYVREAAEKRSPGASQYRIERVADNVYMVATYRQSGAEQRTELDEAFFLRMVSQADDEISGDRSGTPEDS